MKKYRQFTPKRDFLPRRQAGGSIPMAIGVDENRDIDKF